MNTDKKKRLTERGWKVGNAQQFLDLSAEEAAYIEVKLALSKNLKSYRQTKGLTQNEFARKIKSSQSRVAKMESGDASVSLDLLVQSLFALGASRKQLAGMLV